MINAVHMEGIVKHFPGVVANDHISLEIEKGEIHALLGENGSGKTTLMNVLYGFYRPDAGTIHIKGDKVDITSPKMAISHGIGMVHQQFMLVPVFSVTENIILGQPAKREPFLDLKQAEESIARISNSYRLFVDPKANVWQLSVGEQQRVEIIKALYHGADILILDEPTSVLTPQETTELFNVLKRLSAEGKTIIFISHKLREVMELCVRVTVLRDGRVIGCQNTCDTNEKALAKMMVGREVFLHFDKTKCKPGRIMLETSNLNVKNDRGQIAVRNVSFHINEGEIVGIAGVDGNGQTEFADAIMGLRKVHEGNIQIGGKNSTHLTSREIIDMGVGFIPSDRSAGQIGDFTLQENILLRFWAKSRFTKYTLFTFNAIRKFTEKLMEEFGIRAPNSSYKVGYLSGGNQQKVTLARELACEPKLLITSQPTRGLDVGAAEYVRQQILQEREKGVAILLISTELEEVMSLSDRILVMYAGMIVDEIDGQHANVEEIGIMMAGGSKKTVQLDDLNSSVLT